MLRRLLALGVACAAVSPAAAQAATTATSSNWAGYAVTRTTGTFKRVTGRWTVPAVACSATTGATYSANWVGLGGFDDRSQALEQLGTESDCTASGRAVYSAWFEVVPAAAVDARITVRPGDRMAASVTVTGKTVRLRISDLSRGTVEQRTVRAATVDLTSAEWIVEAPSLCTGTSVAAAACRQTGLADFGRTSFTSATATSSAGHVGAIGDRRWTPTAIVLQSGGSAGSGRWNAQAEQTVGGATPSGLTTPSSFTVRYADTTAGTAGTRSVSTVRGAARR